MTTRKVTIQYVWEDNNVHYQVTLDDEALADLITRANELLHDTEDREESSLTKGEPAPSRDPIRPTGWFGPDKIGG